MFQVGDRIIKVSGKEWEDAIHSVHIDSTGVVTKVIDDRFLYIAWDAPARWPYPRSLWEVQHYEHFPRPEDRAEAIYERLRSEDP